MSFAGMSPSKALELAVVEVVRVPAHPAHVLN